MIVKFFSNRGGGSAASSINYLLGKNRDREGATLLSGDPDLSVSIAESLEFKNRYTVGCLSFEESDIDGKAKKEIMDKFESTLFAGMDKDQYNITWIEHTDKNRLELNFFVPNVELKTQKRLQPYYDRADRHLIDSFKKVINHEYELTNPDAIEKKQLVKIDLSTPKPAKKLKEELSKFFIKKIGRGNISNRSAIVETLENAGIEISRITGKSISIKNPEGGRNIRLNGEIYEEEFYEKIADAQQLGESLGEARERERREDREAIERDYRDSEIKLREGIERRADRHQELYYKQDDYGDSLRDLGLSIVRHNIDEERDQQIRDRGDSLGGIEALSERELHGDNENRGLIEALHELSERVKEAIRSARERVKEFKEYLQGVEERERESVRAERQATSCLEIVSRHNDQERERERQITATNRTIDRVASEIKRGKDTGYSMSR